MVVFLYDGIYKFSVKGRSYILEGRLETNDPIIIDKLRSLKFREEVKKVPVKKPSTKKATTKKVKGGK